MQGTKTIIAQLHRFPFERQLLAKAPQGSSHRGQDPSRRRAHNGLRIQIPACVAKRSHSSVYTVRRPQ